MRKDETIKINGYEYIGDNRTNIHLNARRGSGSVGTFIRRSFYNLYSIEVLDKYKEGILWVKFSNTVEVFLFMSVLFATKRYN